MRLKSITLNGFKTFATKTEFEFDDRVTVIVGPNGSGKSNIADAVRWVLGEQSYKLLRGRKTVDMIFHGSDERARAGMASATIVFDNSDGWLPIDFSEVSITRRAYRDGKNEYLINGKQVLLRDVNELLGQSGLAERTYTIIGQGLVDTALALNTDERRSLFEEAAGIGLYRSRREDAENRLEKTRRNLDRVEDILSELKPRLRSLERQAKRAERHDQVRSDLKALMREWYGYHWFRVQEELQEARELEKSRKAQLQRAREKQETLDRKLAQYQTDLQGLRARLNSWHRDLSDHHARREGTSKELAVAQERIRTLEKQLFELDTEQSRLEEQQAARRIRREEVEGEVKDLETELDQAQDQLTRAREKLTARENDRIELDEELSQVQAKLSGEKERLSSLRARQEERREQIQEKQAQLSNFRQEMESAASDLDAREEQLQSSRSEHQHRVSERKDLEKQLEQVNQEIRSGENYLQTVEEKVNALDTEISRLQAELGVLRQAEKKMAGYAEGTKFLLEQAQAGKLSGTLGALSSNLDIAQEYETPIAAALGEYLDAVILEGKKSVADALDLLLQRATRGALLPLDSLAPPEPVRVDRGLDGVIGVASELVQAPPQLRPAVDLLLGQVILLNDKDNLQRVLADQPPGVRAVTLQGEVFFASGQIFAGQDGQPSTLSRSRRRRNWEEQLQRLQSEVDAQMAEKTRVREKISRKEQTREELQAQLEKVQEAQEKAEEQLHQAVLARDQAQQQLHWKQSQQGSLQNEIQTGKQELEHLQDREQSCLEQIESLRGKVREKKDQLDQISLMDERESVSHWKTDVAVTQRALADARERLRERQQTWEDGSRELEALQTRKTELKEELVGLQEKQTHLQEKEQAIEERIQEVRQFIEETEQELEEKEAEQKQLHDAEAQARKTLNQAERAYAQAEVSLTRCRENLERMQERIREDIGLVDYEYEENVSGPTPLPLKGYVEKLPKKKQIPVDLEKNIKSLRRQMRRLGAVNPEAQREYKEVKERHQFLTQQLSDLRKAEADIKEVIAELEVLMEREFRRTFQEVAREFRETFVRLFDGGEGRLVLTNPEDLTQTGVDIEARLPGRRKQSLSLLSGGERSLTAAALIFSLVKISSTPFCVLDEVDAMLDDANVARYRELLRELSRETQFIVITHNRNTVQVADVLYGITMAEDSTSQVLSLKLDEVDEVIA